MCLLLRRHVYLILEKFDSYVWLKKYMGRYHYVLNDLVHHIDIVVYYMSSYETEKYGQISCCMH